MTKIIISVFTLLLLLSLPTLLTADEVQDSTTEWLEDVIGSSDDNMDGCYCE